MKTKFFLLMAVITLFFTSCYCGRPMYGPAYPQGYHPYRYHRQHYGGRHNENHGGNNGYEGRNYTPRR